MMMNDMELTEEQIAKNKVSKTLHTAEESWGDIFKGFSESRSRITLEHFLELNYHPPKRKS